MCHTSYGMHEEDIVSSQKEMGLYGGCWRLFCCHIGFVTTVYVDRGSLLWPVGIGYSYVLVGGFYFEMVLV